MSSRSGPVLLFDIQFFRYVFTKPIMRRLGGTWVPSVPFSARHELVLAVIYAICDCHPSKCWSN